MSWVDWAIGLLETYFWAIMACVMPYVGWLLSQYLKRSVRSWTGKRPTAATLHLFGASSTAFLSAYCLRQQWPDAPFDQVAFVACVLAVVQAVAVKALFDWAEARRPKIAQALAGELYVDDKTTMDTVIGFVAGAKVRKSSRCENKGGPPDGGPDRRQQC